MSPIRFALSIKEFEVFKLFFLFYFYKTILLQLWGFAKQNWFHDVYKQPGDDDNVGDILP